FAIQLVPFFILKHPTRCLAMPNERMPDNEHAILFAEGDVAIRRVEIVSVWSWVDQSPFQDVFWCDGIELRGDDCCSARVNSGKQICVERCSDHKRSFEGILQRR